MQLPVGDGTISAFGVGIKTSCERDGKRILIDRLVERQYLQDGDRHLRVVGIAPRRRRVERVLAAHRVADG
jgi:hypothetical protein